MHYQNYQVYQQLPRWKMISLAQRYAWICHYLNDALVPHNGQYILLMGHCLNYATVLHHCVLKSWMTYLVITLPSSKYFSNSEKERIISFLKKIWKPFPLRFSTHFMPLAFLCSLKISENLWFSMFSGGIDKDQWYKKSHLIP